jgi:hypothetical protein
MSRKRPVIQCLLVAPVPITRVLYSKAPRTRFAHCSDSAPHRQPVRADRNRFDDDVVRYSGLLNKVKRAQKLCSEQFYTDLRWSMSAWLRQDALAPKSKTRLDASIADLPSLKQIGISHPE